MIRSVYDRPPLPDWMRGRVGFRDGDPRWHRSWRPGPDTLDLRVLERGLAAQGLALTGRLSAHRAGPPPPRFTSEQQRRGGLRRMATLNPNARREAAATAGRARWARATSEERRAVGQRLKESRRQRVRLLPASAVDGLGVDTSGRHRCERCGCPGKPYLRELDPGLVVLARVVFRCGRHAFVLPESRRAAPAPSRS
jgi:hypothetical protein